MRGCCAPAAPSRGLPSASGPLGLLSRLSAGGCAGVGLGCFGEQLYLRGHVVSLCVSVCVPTRAGETSDIPRAKLSLADHPHAASTAAKQQLQGRVSPFHPGYSRFCSLQQSAPNTEHFRQRICALMSQPLV